MKAILISIKPQHVANILNGLKTIEVRKKFPKDYVGWVYIYCTKGKPYLSSNSFKYYIAEHYEKYMGNCNGKVVARFWCDRVEEILYSYDLGDKEWFTDSCTEEKDLLKESCLEQYELDDYLQGKDGYAIHITKLEIFDKPKELAQHTHDNSSMFYTKKWDKVFKTWRIGALTRAPQSYCFIEVDL